jgi:hypothetical protein
MFIKAAPITKDILTITLQYIIIIFYKIK